MKYKKPMHSGDILIKYEQIRHAWLMNPNIQTYHAMAEVRVLVHLGTSDQNSFVKLYLKALQDIIADKV